MPDVQSVTTLRQVQEALEATWEKMEALLPELSGKLDGGPNESGWTPQELLSHMVGSWQRVPMHTAFFLDHVDVPIQIGDSCWTPEWKTAPLSAFNVCLQAGYDANKALVSRLEESDLSIEGKTPFGEVNLGEFLMLSYAKHLDEYHMPQLEAFAARK